jgi:tRNA (guanine37-N1)-methyltransferase
VIRIDVLTILPGLFDSFLRESFVGVAQKKDRLVVSVHDLRGWTSDRHRTVDDTPYGGGRAW